MGNANGSPGAGESAAATVPAPAPAATVPAPAPAATVPAPAPAYPSNPPVPTASPPVDDRLRPGTVYYNREHVGERYGFYPEPEELGRGRVSYYNREHVGERYDFYPGELGRGGSGVTRLAVCVATGTHLACKTILKSTLTPAQVEDAEWEVCIMASLPPHPAVVRLHEVYEDEDALHLLMEYCDGGSLNDWVASLLDQNLYTEEAMAMAAWTVAEVVAELHAAGVMHRDLNPDNLLYSSSEGQIKAINFGLAICFHPGNNTFRDVVGSLAYMAPEVHCGYYGPEADIWSAGVIIFELICGYNPFLADTDEGVVYAVMNRELALDLETHPWPRVPDARDLVAQMLHRNPASRPTAQMVLEHRWLINRRQVGAAISASGRCLGVAALPLI